MDLETKSLSLDACEFKLKEDMRIEGYASKFNMVDSYGDSVLPGAYADTIKNRARPIRMHYNHISGVIGKWTHIEEDSHGLVVVGELTKGHSLAQDVYASMKHGAVDGLSIGYRIPPGGSEKAGKVRQLKKIDLIEISVVEDPADLGARISGIKAAISEANTIREVEMILRDAGQFSKADACAIISRIKSLSNSGDRENGAAAKLAQVRDFFSTLKI